MKTNWEQTGEAKRESIHALLPAKWKSSEPVPNASSLPNATSYPRSFLTEREIEITENYEAHELVVEMSKRRMTSVEVTSAFCHRATIAHELVSLSCIVDMEPVDHAYRE